VCWDALALVAAVARAISIDRALGVEAAVGVGQAAVGTRTLDKTREDNVGFEAAVIARAACAKVKDVCIGPQLRLLLQLLHVQRETWLAGTISVAFLAYFGGCINTC